MVKSKVIVLPCETYEEEKVDACVREGIRLLGGLDQILNDDRKILVKPNLLKPSTTDSAVTTHPAVLNAVLKQLEEAGGCEVRFGDSPGHDHGEKVLKGIGIDTKGAVHGAEFAPMVKETKVDFPDGITAKEFYFAREVTEADAVINVCKMKTHAMMVITGAVKNPFGLVCGTRKAMSHVLYPTESAFAGMLSDIHRAVRIPLHIMDAVVAMEGNGPGSGDPVEIGLILMSQDPVAIDAVFCRLIGLDPEEVPTEVQGESAGIGTYHEDRIELILSDQEGVRETDFSSLVQRYGKPDFKVERKKKSALTRLMGVLSTVQGRPVINRKKCIRCGICVQHCPVQGHAVNFTNGRDKPPVYDYKKCIRCFCCQEMCPQKAITKGRIR